jgi:hypothetical protein
MAFDVVKPQVNQPFACVNVILLHQRQPPGQLVAHYPPDAGVAATISPTLISRKRLTPE